MLRRVREQVCTGGLHFTVGTDPSFEPSTEQLSLENDTRLLKAGLLYADRVRLVSVGSSLALRMLNDARSDPDRQLDFLERHFRENISRDDPEAAATMLEFVRLYRPLRRGRNLSKEQLRLKLQLSRGSGRYGLSSKKAGKSLPAGPGSTRY